MEHKVIIYADQERLDSVLAFCRDRFGHRGNESGWWWAPYRAFRTRQFIFSFRDGEDAVAFKLTYENIQV